MAVKIKWTDEVIQFMVDNYKGKDNIELAELLNKQFNLNTNGDRVSNVKANLLRRKGIDLRTGINRGCIKKGNIPSNKGKKWSEYLSIEQQQNCLKTAFKKGNKPHNRRELFEERITKDGYIEIKVQDNSLNDNWKFKHRYIWEQHNGEIPKGYVVIFLDNNRQNCNIDNLTLINRNQLKIMNERKLKYSNKELTESGILVAKMLERAGTK